MTLAKKLGAKFLGMFWLVFDGCGSAVLAAGFACNGFCEHSPVQEGQEISNGVR